MISKNQIKYIRGLHSRKNRKKESVFIVEGPKIVEEFILSSFDVMAVYGTQEWIENAPSLLESAEMISEKELHSISAQKNPNQVLAIVRMPKQSSPPKNIDSLCLVLDTIQDPGNLGTIIRIADWFDIKQIICSEETADIYNPKVVQSTMGSLTRVNVSYTNLIDYLDSIPKDTAIYGTLLEGDNIYESDLKTKGLIIVGNESKGISKEVKSFVNHKIKIPAYGDSKTESLNAAIATSIIVSEFRRIDK